MGLCLCLEIEATRSFQILRKVTVGMKRSVITFLSYCDLHQSEATDRCCLLNQSHVSFMCGLFSPHSQIGFFPPKANTQSCIFPHTT